MYQVLKHALSLAETKIFGLHQGETAKASVQGNKPSPERSAP
jgi:hypothetical protein